MVDAEHGEAVEGDVLDEDLEAAMQRFLAAVELHVLGVDVGDHGDGGGQLHEAAVALVRLDHHPVAGAEAGVGAVGVRSEEHTSELQSLMRISYAVFCLKKKKHQQKNTNHIIQYT